MKDVRYLTSFCCCCCFFPLLVFFSLNRKRSTVRNVAFVSVLIGVVTLTTSVPDLFREQSKADAAQRREVVSEETKAKFRRATGD